MVRLYDLRDEANHIAARQRSVKAMATMDAAPALGTWIASKVASLDERFRAGPGLGPPTLS